MIARLGMGILALLCVASTHSQNLSFDIQELRGPSGERIFGFGLAYDLDASPIEDEFATAGTLGAFVWNLESRQMIRWLQHPMTKKIQNVRYTPDGQRLITASNTGRIFVWNPKSGELLNSFETGGKPLSRIDPAPDGRHIATTAILSGTVELWNISTGTRTRSFAAAEDVTEQDIFPLEEFDPIRSISFSPDGESLIINNMIWDAESGDQVARIRTGDFAFFRPLQNDIISFSQSVAAIISATDYTSVLDTESAPAPVYDTICKPNANFTRYIFVNSTLGRTAARGNVFSRTYNDFGAFYEGPKGDFTFDGNRYLSISDTQDIELWDLDDPDYPVQPLSLDIPRIPATPSTERIDPAIEHHSGPVNDVKFHPADNIVVSSGGWLERPLTVWNLDEGKTYPRYVQSLPFYYGNVYMLIDEIAFRSDQNLVGLSNVGQQTFTWRLENRLIFSSISPNQHASAFNLSSISERDSAVVADKGGELNFYPDLQMKERKDLLTTRNRAWVTSVHHDEQTILVTDITGKMYFYRYDPQLGNVSNSVSLTASFQSDHGMITASAIRGDELPITSHFNGYITIWNDERIEFDAGQGVINDIAMTPDGDQFASAGQDGSIVIWNAKTGYRTAVLEGHLREVTSVEFSDDGTLLASSSNDGTVRLWSVDEFTFIPDWRRH